MKTSKKLQRGASFWETSLYVLVFLFVVTAVLKIGPHYMDDVNISSTLNGIHEGLAGKDIAALTNSELKGRLSKSFQVSMLSGEIEKQVEIDRAGGQVKLLLDYETRFPFMGNIDIVLHFNHEVNLSEPLQK